MAFRQRARKKAVVVSGRIGAAGDESESDSEGLGVPLAKAPARRGAMTTSWEMMDGDDVCNLVLCVPCNFHSKWTPSHRRSSLQSQRKRELWLLHRGSSTLKRNPRTRWAQQPPTRPRPLLLCGRLNQPKWNLNRGEMYRH